MRKTITPLFAGITMLFFLGSVAAQSTYAPTWDKEIAVTQGEEQFPDKNTYHAYSTLIYETTKSDIQKLVLEEINSKTADNTKKKALKEGVPVALPAFGGEEIAVKVMADDIKKTDQVKVSVAFFKDSAAINPTDFPKEDKSAQEVMHNLAVTLNKGVVTGQIESTNKDLESMQKKYDGLVKDSVKLYESINQANETIANLESNTMKQESKLTKAKSDAAQLEVMAKSSAGDAKDMKKYSKAQSKVTSIEQTKMKNSQKIAKQQSDIQQAELEKPQLRKQIMDLAAQIETQKELITKLQAKLEAIK